MGAWGRFQSQKWTKKVVKNYSTSAQQKFAKKIAGLGENLNGLSENWNWVWLDRTGASWHRELAPNLS